MRMYDLIKKKRDGQPLSGEEIRFFVSGYTSGEIPDYQAAALCMAIYFRGMDLDEITALTFAVRDSGDILTIPGFHGVRVDKHSTGGVGDKTSLVVAPIVAACGIPIAKMSGRALGHTGGTVDKLESIPGYRTDLTTEEFLAAVEKTGLSLIGQSAVLAPADKKLYALRDVTATVDSIPLIVSSIMGKKLAANDDCIVLDVKTGSGSFMKTPEDSRKLAEIMVEIGKRAGKKMLARITDMDVPLGRTIGNSLEVIEAVETLKGKGPEDLEKLSLVLASDMLELAGKGSREECEKMAESALRSGSALETLARMVENQGGDAECIRHPERFPSAACSQTVCAASDGYIARVDTERYGIASLLLGAGRNRKEDPIDYSAGIRLIRKTGEKVTKGDPIAVLYTNDPDRFPAAADTLLQATEITAEKPEERPLLFFEVR